jgi:cell division cycle 14
MQLGWYDHKTFDVKEYDYYSSIEGGDMNWIIPGKFVAFPSPNNIKLDEDDGVKNL